LTFKQHKNGIGDLFGQFKKNVMSKFFNENLSPDPKNQLSLIADYVTCNNGSFATYFQLFPPNQRFEETGLTLVVSSASSAARGRLVLIYAKIN